MSYAFAPLLPLLIAAVNLVLHNVLLSAFVTAQLILLAIFWLVYWLVARWYDERLAARTVWLLLLYPFSVVYRGYFSEGPFLLLLVAFMNASRQRRWPPMAFTAGGVAVGDSLVHHRHHVGVPSPDRGFAAVPVCGAQAA